MKVTMHPFNVGDWVEVRSKEEILATLDENGELDGMPFMPEMFAFCGRRFQVYKRAHKTCDTVFPVRGRRLRSTIHLQTRCDGQAHGDCHAGCLIFWKEAWVKRVDQSTTPHTKPNAEPRAALVNISAGVCSESNVWEKAKAPGADGNAPAFRCQATQLPYATEKLAWWDLRQYIEDYRSGNVSLSRIFNGAVYAAYRSLAHAGIGVGPVMRWFYDLAHPLWGGTLFPHSSGRVKQGEPTPTATLNLQPGELVRVKSHVEILQTLEAAYSRNRGLYFDAEMVPYCGGTYRVLRRVTQILDEKTGKMLKMKTPSVILDTVVCQSRYSHCRMFCPRGIYSYWREVWLERVEEPAAIQTRDSSVSREDARQAVPAGQSQ